MPNRLERESSPYLRQHAENPVDWYPWCDEAFSKAQEEGKLVLVSIGYSSCHWCHVMEHETFSDDRAAEIMNRYFVCIKVDREERPDIDQVYMNAVQLMSGQGGWPLNCFTLPDGRPVYGGTYFPREQWMRVLHHLNALWKDETEKVLDYAERLTEGIRLSDLVAPSETEQNFTEEQLHKMVDRWKTHFDHLEGGPNRAPKFPLPNNYLFLLRYAHRYEREDVMKHVHLTLSKMAMGGIYDQLGGGITRYSTDMIWKVPHFEKMLYDNAQVLSLYSEAYRHSKDPLFLETIHSTAEFCLREWLSPGGGFYSAFDADSEGEEGKYYIWKKEELQSLLGDDYAWFSDYYSINYLGEWEHGNYILLRRERDMEFAVKRKFTLEEFRLKKARAHRVLMEARSKRVRPLLDDKILCSWNAMMISGLADAWRASGKEEYRKHAVDSGHFILRELLKGDGGLWHCYHEGKAYVDGFLEDYAFSIQAFADLFLVTGDEQWLQFAIKWVDYVERHFSDPESGLYFFTSSASHRLIARKTEISDNVVPASNSVLARALALLGQLVSDQELTLRANKMLQAVYPHISGYGAGYSNWGMALMDVLSEQREVVVCSADASMHLLELMASYLPQVLMVPCPAAGELPVLKNRFINGETLFYVCRNNSCTLPVRSTREVLEQLK